MSPMPRLIVFGVYDWYTRLYLAHPEQLRWMPFANMGGTVEVA